MEERVVARTVINSSITVLTVERIDAHELVGLHAVLKTFLIGVEGVDPNVAYVSYMTEQAAQLGHEQIAAETRREIVKKEAVDKYGIPVATAEGWL